MSKVKVNGKYTKDFVNDCRMFKASVVAKKYNCSTKTVYNCRKALGIKNPYKHPDPYAVAKYSIKHTLKECEEKFGISHSYVIYLNAVGRARYPRLAIKAEKYKRRKHPHGNLRNDMIVYLSQNYSCEQIAKVFHVSRQRIHQLVKIK